MSRPELGPAVAGLPDLQTLLVAGGDERLHLDPATGQNVYGTELLPREGVIELGSCTVSAMSRRALAAAERAYRRFARAEARGDALGGDRTGRVARCAPICGRRWRSTICRASRRCSPPPGRTRSWCRWRWWPPGLRGGSATSWSAPGRRAAAPCGRRGGLTPARSRRSGGRPGAGVPWRAASPRG